MRSYVQVSGILFVLLTLAHLLRLLARWPLVVAGRPLSALVSLVALLVAGTMSVWAWRVLREPPAA